MQRYFIEISYNGANYVGWQSQPNGVAVQEVLDERLSRLSRAPVATVGAGRTDAGVHAAQLYAHFDLPSPLPDPGDFCRRLGLMLPPDIAARRVVAVHPGAHARFDARRRSYRYLVSLGKQPFAQGLALRLDRAPDIAAMNAAAEQLSRESDFASFCKAGADNKTTLCRVERAAWGRAGGGAMLVFEITADRFLRNMVRSVVGTLLDVGFGKLSAEGFARVLAARDRSAAGQSVAPHGLYLTRVEYDYIAPLPEPTGTVPYLDVEF